MLTDTNPASQPPDHLAQNSFEASLAPRDGDLLSLPFDQYGRMRIVQNVINTLYTEMAGQAGHIGDESYRLRVLDVGGYPGILRHFLNDQNYEVSVIDLPPDDGTIPGYIQGSGLDLPFGDASFDVVTSLDTLEHIPNNDRSRFLSEIMRVSASAAVMINPIQSVENDLAEETLNEYIRWILDAQQEQLAEHREYGLPGFEVTAEAFELAGWQTARFSTANIHSWLFMMVAKHYLISMRDERAAAFERTLDRFYNLTFSDSDRREPAYRGVLVATRPGLEAALEKVHVDYPPMPDANSSNTERIQLAQLLMSMLNLKLANHEDYLLREQIERRDRHITGLEHRVALQEQQIETFKQELFREREATRAHMIRLDQNLTTKNEHILHLDKDILNKNEHILYLEKLLQGIEAGRVMRLTRSVSRFLDR